MGFKKGAEWKGNKDGAPRKPEIQELREALAKVAAEEGRTFLEHFVRRSFKDDQCAIALARKIVPDKIEDAGEARKIIIELGLKSNADTNGK